MLWPFRLWSEPVRTKLSTCIRKTRFRSEPEALIVALNAGVPLRPYRCDRCRRFHLTSRTKGKRLPRLPDRLPGRAADSAGLPVVGLLGGSAAVVGREEFFRTLSQL
jgi:hypothetical protein